MSWHSYISAQLENEAKVRRRGRARPLEVEYAEPETEPDPTSTDPEEISRCPRANIVACACAHAIEGMEVARVRRRVTDEEPRHAEAAYGSPEEMQARAKEDCFVRDPGQNLVWRPNGERLRQTGAGRFGSHFLCHGFPSRRAGASAMSWEPEDRLT